MNYVVFDLETKQSFDDVGGFKNAHKLGISVEELQSYFDEPNKTYKDYKSQEGIYNWGAKVMRMLGLEKGGKR